MPVVWLCDGDGGGSSGGSGGGGRRRATDDGPPGGELSERQHRGGGCPSRHARPRHRRTRAQRRASQTCGNYQRVRACHGAYRVEAGLSLFPIPFFRSLPPSKARPSSSSQIQISLSHTPCLKLVCKRPMSSRRYVRRADVERGRRAEGGRSYVRDPARMASRGTPGSSRPRLLPFRRPFHLESPPSCAPAMRVRDASGG